MPRAARYCPNCGVLRPAILGKPPNLGAIPDAKWWELSLGWGAGGGIFGLLAAQVACILVKRWPEGFGEWIAGTLANAIAGALSAFVISSIVIGLARLPRALRGMRLRRYERLLLNRSPLSLTATLGIIERAETSLNRQVEELAKLLRQVDVARGERDPKSGAATRLEKNAKLLQTAIDERRRHVAAARIESERLIQQRWRYQLEALTQGVGVDVEEVRARLRELERLTSVANEARANLERLAASAPSQELLEQWSEARAHADRMRLSLQLREEQVLHRKTQALVKSIHPIEEAQTLSALPELPSPEEHESELVELHSDVRRLVEEQERLEAECEALNEVEQLVHPKQRRIR